MTASQAPAGLLAAADASRARLASVDAYRGTAIVLMVVGNFAMPVSWFPDVLRHAPDIGFTVADLVAPMFMLSVALTAPLSVQRRRAQFGTRPALSALANRALLLIGVGAILSAGQALEPSGQIPAWGVLQAIGGAILLLVPVILAPAWWRLAYGVLLLGLYQWLLDSFFLPVVLRTSFNGLVGTISWAGFIIIASAIGDLVRAITGWLRPLVLLTVGLCAATVALQLSPWMPISKNRASATYMILALGLSLAVFAFYDMVFQTRPEWLGWLQKVGWNSLTLYLSHLPLIGLFLLLPAPLYVGAAPWLTITEAAAVLAVVLTVSHQLARRGIQLRF